MSEIIASEIPVTVVIPVFNKHRTLRRAVDSVLAQTHQALEIIITDDLSTDDSLSIANNCALKDSRIRVIESNSKSGLYNNRIKGIKAATGAATTFLDADDTMEPRAIELMLKSMLEYDTDIVQMRFRRRMKGLGIKYLEQWDPALADRRIDGIDFRSLASYVGMDSYILPSCWVKMYRTHLLQSIDWLDFPQFWGEDQIFNIQYLRNCRSISFVDYVGYNYFWGGDTTTYKFSLLREYKNVHAIKRVMGQSEEYINAEIKQLLRYHVRQLFTELSWTLPAVEKVIRDELRDPLWKQVGLEVSAEQLVKEEWEAVQRSPLKYLIKKLLK
ncbi:MAG: glycosyltransferase family 2 protein [Bacteroidales bacterium]|nr:glycosyltransferase family 2 protein [Bacteroidales bacterium]